MNAMREEIEKDSVSSNVSDKYYDRLIKVTAVVTSLALLALAASTGNKMGANNERNRLAPAEVKEVEAEIAKCRRDLETLLQVAESVCEKVKEDHSLADTQDFKNVRAGLDDLIDVRDKVHRYDLANGETTFRNQDQMEVTVEINDLTN